MTFFVHGVPAPKGSIRAFVPRGWKRPILTSDTGPRLKDWANSVSICALEARGASPLIAGAVGMEIIFYLARPKSAKKRMHVTVKPDVDKLLRAALDPLKGILFNDDSQVVHVTAAKKYADDSNPPGAKITISEIICHE